MKLLRWIPEGRSVRLLVLPFFFLLPFMQMGITYYLSIQTLLLVFLIYHLSLKVFIKQAYWYFLLFMLMVAPSILYVVDNQGHMLLWALRLLLCAMLLIAALSYRPKIKLDVATLEKPLIGSLIILLLFTLIQFIGLKTGHPVVLSSSLFVANQGTMEGFEKALSFGLENLLRPTAFYGEPSYLSFIVTSLLFISLSVFQDKKKIRLVVALAMVTCLLSQSFSGFASVVILVFVFYAKKSATHVLMIMVLGGIALIVLSTLSDNLWFADRLLSVGSQESSVIRLVMPFEIISYTFAHYPFGMSQDVFQAEFPFGLLGTDNGFLNMFINFGFSGFIIWAVIFYKARYSILLVLYLILSSMFNGAFLMFDKVAIIGFCVIFTKIACQPRIKKEGI